MSKTFFAIVIIVVSCAACGGDERTIEIENNELNMPTPRERAEDKAARYNAERRNDEANFRCHVCRAVVGECGENFDRVDAPPCEWRAVFEEPIPNRSGVWSVECEVIPACIDDTFACDTRCP